MPLTTRSHSWKASEPITELSLVVLSDGRPQIVRLPDEGEVLLGRDDTCDVIVNDTSMSREHASLRIRRGRSGPELTLEDLKSRNGTRVTGTRITGAVPVALNQVIELGGVVMVIRGPGAAPPTPTTTRPTKVAALGPKMTEAYALADLAAPTPVTVLLLGETGVGKTALVERIHAQSGRRGQLVKLNCAAVPENLLEAELFGHERGAFTGAQAAKEGLIEAAADGTLLLDEIGDMPLATQAKLLHVVEEGEVMRLGATKPRKVDVRFVAATHRDLGQMVTEKVFRADLYYRINGIAITIPPLRERREEVIGLAEHFLSLTWAKMKRDDAPPGLVEDARAALVAYPWPGNLRELRNVMDRAALFGSKTGSVTAAALGLPQAAAPVAAASGADLRGDLEAFEREKIVRALEQTSGHQGKAAELVGLPLRTFVKRLTHYGLTKKKT